MIIKIYLIGVIVLFFAILANVVVIYFRIDTWYSFLEEARKVGIYKAFFNLSIIAKLFLILIYPMILGLSAYIALKFIK